MPENNIKKYDILQPLLLSLMVVGGMFLGRKMESSSIPELSVSSTKQIKAKSENNLIEEATRFIEARYLDSIAPNLASDLAIQAMIQNLDPFSSYLPFEKSVTDNSSFLEVFGLDLKRVQNNMIVTAISPGGSAFKASLNPGDRILSINNQVLEKMISEPYLADSAYLDIVPRHQKDTQALLLVKDHKPLQSVGPVMPIAFKTGYVRILHFSDNTYDEFITALDTLVTKHKIKNLIIDLRQNHGGYLEECTRILNQLFEEKGLLMASTQGRTLRRTEFRTDGRRLYEIASVITLVDEGSASASEVFAGVMQDLDRGIVIGSPSYGKGFLQEQYMLSNGSALRISVARIYLASGRSIHKEKGPVHKQNSVFKSTKGKILATGQGIIPDLILKPDSSFQTTYWQNIEKTIASFCLLEWIKSDMESEKKMNSIFLYNEFIRTNPVWRHVEVNDRNRLKYLIQKQIHSLRGEYGELTKESIQADPLIKMAITLLK